VKNPASSQRWYGKLIGVAAGFMLLRADPVLGALLGLLIGHAVDAGWSGPRRDDPYRVLGLTDEASDAEIDLARRRLIAQHHPDRATAGTRREAERNARDINAAYARIRTLRKDTPRHRTQ
jgi:preprotein translocase subunit Sec63